MTSDIRQEVLRLFEQHRAVKEARFDESHFLDYLLSEPKSRRAVYNSFRGLRRYNAFLNAVQMHFGVYFSKADFDANYPLPKFVARVAELQASRRSSLSSFKSAQKHGFGWHVIVFANILAISLVAFAFRYSEVASYGLAACVVAANAAVVRFYVNWANYRRRLLAKIESAPAHDA
jgi:hypothetical protein